MKEWLNENLGIILTFFNLVPVVAISRRDRATTSDLEAKDSALAAKDSALTAKDATIELLRTQSEGFSKKAAEYEDYKKQNEQHNAIMDDTIAMLHKRISELESQQFFSYDKEANAIRLKGHAPEQPEK